MSVSSVKNLNGSVFSAVQDAELTEVVQTNSASWGAGSTPTYDYTQNALISAIDTSGLYAQSAASASHLNHDGTMGENVAQSYNGNNFYYMPLSSPFGKPQGIFSPLQYATGACLAMSGGNFGAYYKGNEWYVCNPNIGQMLRGEVHQSRGVHISGATTAGTNFDLSVNAVRGKSSPADNYNWKLERSCVSGYDGNGWRYGAAEDTALRTVSALEYNAVDEISGIAGSAIAQYGAEKQWLQHDDTIVHVANSAQYAFGVNVSALQRLMGIDETVLFSGKTPTLNSTFSIAEPFSSFNKIMFKCKNGENAIPTYYDTDTLQTKIVLNGEWAYNWMQKVYFKCDMVTPTSYSYTANTVEILKHTGTAVSAALQVIQNDTSNSTGVWTIIGIGRKA